MISSYSTIFALGHKAVAPLLDVEVIVEEKIDGSQFSFGKIDGELQMRSKSCQVFMEMPGMFEAATTTCDLLMPDLPEGVIFRCEYLSKPHHNVLTYEREPKQNLIVYDIEDPAFGGFIIPEMKRQWCKKFNLETVPLLFEGKITLDKLQELLYNDSILGGTKIEGVVIKPKNYDLYGTDKKVLMGKYVSEAFKEKHAAEWKGSNPTKSDVVQFLIKELNTEARWQKAVQHLREAGKLEEGPKAIGALMKEVKADVLKEEREYITEKVMQNVMPQIMRAIGSGLPEWFKKKLAEEQFNAIQRPEEETGKLAKVVS